MCYALIAFRGLFHISNLRTQGILNVLHACFCRNLFQISALATSNTQCVPHLFLYVAPLKISALERGICNVLRTCSFTWFTSNLRFFERSLRKVLCACFYRNLFQISGLRARFTQRAIRLFLCVAYLKCYE